MDVAAAGTAAVRYRKVNRSPDEEYAARLARVAPLRKFPREVVAAFLFQFKELTVTRAGLAMKLGKERYVYWHEHSQVCARVGQTFSVGYQLEDLDWVAVFDARGALVEIVPQKIRAPWFDDEALRQARRAVAQANNRIKERFAHLHAPTAEARLNRALSNAERLQIVNTFPLPVRPGTAQVTEQPREASALRAPAGEGFEKQNAEGGRRNPEGEMRSEESSEFRFPNPGFERAHELAAAGREIVRLRGARAAEEQRAAERLAAEEDDLTVLDRGAAKLDDPYAISMEELNEF